MTRAPGPKGSLIWGSLAPFKADSLGFLGDMAAQYGDVVRMRFGPFTAHLLNHPDHIAQVLSRHAPRYDKATRSADRIAATTGASLMSADATAWQRHRRLVQPAFQPRCFETIGPDLDALVTPMLARWRKAGTINIVDEMMQLVIAATIKTLFSTDVDAQKIAATLEVLLADTWRRIEAPLDASMLSPLLHRPSFKRAVGTIDDIVLSLIRARRISPEAHVDVLTRLLAAHKAEGAEKLTDTELRDAAVTLLLAGHETTANALSWAFIHAVDGKHEAQDPAHIFAEALRLYPSIWVIERRVKAEETIGGYNIPRGSSVLISPYLLHRRADFWPEPEAFEPSRFANAQFRVSDAYMPFGLGQHRCVGLHLANRIAAHVLKRVFAECKLALVPGQTLGTSAGITLRHAGPVRMQVRGRS